MHLPITKASGASEGFLNRGTSVLLLSQPSEAHWKSMSCFKMQIPDPANLWKAGLQKPASTQLVPEIEHSGVSALHPNMLQERDAAAWPAACTLAYEQTGQRCLALLILQRVLYFNKNRLIASERRKGLLEPYC